MTGGKNIPPASEGYRSKPSLKSQHFSSFVICNSMNCIHTWDSHLHFCIVKIYSATLKSMKETLASQETHRNCRLETSKSPIASNILGESSRFKPRIRLLFYEDQLFGPQLISREVVVVILNKTPPSWVHLSSQDSHVWLSNKPLKWAKDATHSSQTCLKTSWVLE